MSLTTLKAAAVCHWALEENGTDDRVDDVGSSDAVPSGSIAAAAGMFGNGADFEDGDARNLSVADNAEVSAGDIKFFIRFWMKPETIPIGNPLTKDDGGGSARDYGFYYSSGIIFYVFGSGGEFTQVVLSGVLSPDTWYEVWGWHDPDNNIINGAVNGTVATPVAHTAGIRDSGQALVIGSRGDNAAYFDGVIDDVVLGKGEIPSSQDVSDSYDSGTGVAFADWSGGDSVLSVTTSISSAIVLGASKSSSLVQVQSPSVAVAPIASKSIPIDFVAALTTVDDLIASKSAPLDIVSTLGSAEGLTASILFVLNPVSCLAEALDLTSAFSVVLGFEESEALAIPLFAGEINQIGLESVQAISLELSSSKAAALEYAQSGSAAEDLIGGKEVGLGFSVVLGSVEDLIAGKAFVLTAEESQGVATILFGVGWFLLPEETLSEAQTMSSHKVGLLDSVSTIATTQQLTVEGEIVYIYVANIADPMPFETLADYMPFESLAEWRE